MSCGTILNQLLKDGTLSQVLQRNSTSKDEVKALNQILFELGFDEVMDDQSKQVYSSYGDSTVATIKSFCEKNDIISDGEKVTEEIAKMILKRYERLPDMLQLHFDLKNGNISKKYFKGSTDKQAIGALQNLLHDLGFKNELEWEKNQNNGEYGQSTINAVKAYISKKEKDLIDKVPLVKKDGLIQKCGNVISHLLKKGGLSSVLQKSEIPSAPVKELQTMLHHLGFGKKLGQEIHKLDGVFGSSVVDTVKSFASKNGISTDGTKITQSVAVAIQDKLKTLPFMHQLERDLREGKVEEKYFKGSKDKLAISALQTVLSKLGVHKELNWDKKGNDGVFDNTVVKGLKSYFKKGFFSKIKTVTPNMMQDILTDVSKGFGPDWKDHVKELKGNADSVLTTFSASNFQGIHVVTNVAFVPTLLKINKYAVNNSVHIKVTNAYRRGTHVPGAIVKPASMSNHKVGHAIDMNLIFGNGELANSTYMHPSNRSNWASPVKGFLDDIINDPELRWGGTFGTGIDPVHIDDDLNHKDPDEWHKQRALTVKAFDSGDIQQWKG